MGHKRKETVSPDLAHREAWPFNPMNAEDTGDLLDDCLQALQDARRSTREAGLAALAGALEALPPVDEIDSRCFNAFALCGVCIKEGTSVKEARLAYRVVGLLALTARAGTPGILALSFPLLSRTLKEDNDALTTVAALDCLAAVTFAGALKEDVERSMNAVWDVVISPPPVSRPSKPSGRATRRNPNVLVAAVSTWTFLLTTIVAVTDAPPPRKAEHASWNAAVASLIGLLEHDDRAVRMAAGEALAVCVELNLTQHAPRRDMDALAARASELASEPAGKFLNNTMLPKQKELFRKIAAFLDHGERLEECLPTSADGCVALRVSTWAKLSQLNFLRRFLGDGFLKHVQENDLFVEAFSYGADEGKVLSIANKKCSSKTEKELKVKKCDMWDWNICSSFRQARYKPKTLMQIGWQARI